MMDEDRTMQLFGYTSDEISQSSNKKVVAVCEECGIYRCVRKRSYRDLCFICSRSRTGENNPLWKEKVVKICEICGKEFSMPPSLSQQRFCSRKCQSKWMSENTSGENSPFFGKTPSLEVRKRVSATLQGISYDDWESFAEDQPYCPKFNERCRESNREKYDRCCFLPGTTEAKNGKKLSVHHVDMNKAQGCDGHSWKLVPLSTKWHGHAHAPTWMARIQYLLNHVWRGA